MKTKTIRIKKRGGGTRLQKVQVLASGKYKFIKNPKGATRKARPSRAKPKRKVRRSMARRKRRRRRSGMTIPLAPVGALLATPAVRYAISEAMAGNLAGALAQPARFAGIDPNTGEFSMHELSTNTLPLVIGLLVHKFVGGSPLNMNRMLARANVPFLRI